MKRSTWIAGGLAVLVLASVAWGLLNLQEPAPDADFPSVLGAEAEGENALVAPVQLDTSKAEELPSRQRDVEGVFDDVRIIAFSWVLGT